MFLDKNQKNMELDEVVNDVLPLKIWIVPSMTQCHYDLIRWADLLFLEFKWAR